MNNSQRMKRYILEVTGKIALNFMTIVVCSVTIKVVAF